MPVVAVATYFLPDKNILLEMNELQHNYQFKLVLIGDTNTGKSKYKRYTPDIIHLHKDKIICIQSRKMGI